MKRMFPKAKINPTAVLTSFRRCKITRKQIRIPKKPRSLVDINAHFLKTKSQIEEAVAEGRRIVWTDASLFHRTCIQAKVYTYPNRPLELKDSLVNKAKPFWL